MLLEKYGEYLFLTQIWTNILRPILIQKFSKISRNTTKYPEMLEISKKQKEITSDEFSKSTRVPNKGDISWKSGFNSSGLSFALFGTTFSPFVAWYTQVYIKQDLELIFP